MRRFPPLLEMIEGLVGTPSVSSVDPAIDQGNRAVIDLLAGWLDDSGFQTEIMPLPGDPEKANLIATLGSGPGGLVLAGHVDTVPYDVGKWSHDPFSLTEADARLYGLGTSDMKSFLALALEAGRDVQASDLKEPLILLATADEETSMSGARALVAAQRPHARHAIIGEPTGLQPVRMHKGILMEAIRLHGHSGHSSDPSLGNSALEAMHTVVGAILAWRDELQQRHQDPLFDVPVPTLNLGHIHGGDNPNRICGHCELQIDIRPLPGMKLEDLRNELEQRLYRCLAGTMISFETDALFDGVPAIETPADSQLVKAVERLTGMTSYAVAFSTEAPFYNNLGMETVVMGPVHIDQANKPNEYLALSQITPMVKLVQPLVQRYCM